MINENQDVIVEISIDSVIAEQEKAFKKDMVFLIVRMQRCNIGERMYISFFKK